MKIPRGEHKSQLRVEICHRNRVLIVPVTGIVRCSSVHLELGERLPGWQWSFSWFTEVCLAYSVLHILKVYT